MLFKTDFAIWVALILKSLSTGTIWECFCPLKPTLEVGRLKAVESIANKVIPQLLIIFLLLLSATFGQPIGFRFDSIAYSANGGAVSAVVQPRITVCPVSSAVANCNLNRVTTFTDGTLSLACGLSVQVVLTQTTTCVATDDSIGDVGFWVPPGSYAYMISGTEIAPKLYILTVAGAGNAISGSPSVGTQVGGNGSAFVSQPKPVIDARANYGAIGDGQVATDCYMTSGSAVLTCESNHFVVGDVGKKIAVYGSGPTASGNIQPCSGNITVFTSATQVTTSCTAGNSTTHAIATITNCSRANNIATCTTSASHNFQAGQMVNLQQIGVSGFTADNTTFTGVWPIQTVPTGSSFTINSVLLPDVASVPVQGKIRAVKQ